MGHRSYLDYEHRWRSEAHEFNGTIEIRDALTIPSGVRYMNN